MVRRAGTNDKPMSQHQARWGGLSARTLKFAVPAVLALGAGGAIAVGAIPSADGTITGCYTTVGDGVPVGSLRVVDNPNQCQANEKPLTWNQRGPQGAPGAKGDPGSPGAPGGGAPGGAGRIFLKLDGIPGASSDQKHKNEIEAGTFSVGVTNSTAGSGTGGGAGKAHFLAFFITKPFDVSSPKLFLAAASGTHIKTATISFVTGGSKPLDYLKYTFSDVIILSDRQQNGTSESISFNYSRVKVSYFTQKPDGSLGPPVEAGFDVKGNKKL